MEGKNWVGAGILLVILAGIFAYALTRPTPAPSSPTEDASSLPPAMYEEHEQYYDIALHYPQRTPLRESAGAQADEAAVTGMKTFVMDAAAQFKQNGNFSALTPEDIRALGLDTGRRLTLDMDYLVTASPRTLSYVFVIHEDTGGAHGNTYFRTFTFDTETGEALSLADLFVSGADYLGILSGVARTRLPGILGDILDEQMLLAGTGASAENFENFFLDEDTLTILFAPYQVAAYAAGPQTLAIPRAELAQILKPEYR